MVFAPDNLSVLMSKLSEAKLVTSGFSIMICSHNACLFLSISDFRLMSIFYRVSSPTQSLSLFTNYTTGLLPVSNFSVTPKANSFPGKKFP